MSRAMKNARGLEALARDFAATQSQERRLISKFLNSVESPLAKEIADLFEAGDDLKLLGIDIDPTTYSADQAWAFGNDYLAICFLSKFTGLNTGLDKKQRAIDKFFQMEDHCRETNRRFKSYSELENSEYATWLFVMRRKIDQILGEFSIERLYEMAAWGPGVTAHTKGDDTSQTRKFQSEIGISHEAYALFGSSLGAAYPTWFRTETSLDESAVQIVEGNTISTVDKNAKIDRVITVGPGIDSWLQRGAGKMIAKCLRSWGIDLTDQTRNQELSRVGSISGDLATVDFSSASDTIAWALVQKLLPETWFTVLNSLRSKRGKIEGVEHNWEKFSSMGIGFTFELESLIFYTAALVACEFEGVPSNSVSVFGDDVIIPTSAFDSYVKFSEFLGFIVNKDKSFGTGHFRESCGAHWFNGFDVKPIYLKGRLKDAVSICKFANSIRRLAHRRNNYTSCDRAFADVWDHTVSVLPRPLRELGIPDGYGDVGLIKNFDEVCPPRSPDGHDSYECLSLQERSVQTEHYCHGLLCERLVAIRGPSIGQHRRWIGGSGSFIVPLKIGAVEQRKLLNSRHQTVAHGNKVGLRDRTTLRVTSLSVRSWYNLGSWL